MFITIYQPIVAQMQTDVDSMTEAINVQVTGFFVVLAVLSFVWITLELLGFYFKRFVMAPEEEALSIIDEATISTEPGEVTPEIVAVVGAVVHTMIQEPHQILSIKPVANKAQQAQAWSVEGRRQIAHSHRVR